MPSQLNHCSISCNLLFLYALAAALPHHSERSRYFVVWQLIHIKFETQLYPRTTLKTPPLIYTFGQPRLGNAAFADLAVLRLKYLGIRNGAANFEQLLVYCR